MDGGCTWSRSASSPGVMAPFLDSAASTEYCPSVISSLLRSNRRRRPASTRAIRSSPARVPGRHRSGPAAARAAAGPDRCRPGTLAGELRIALVLAGRRLRFERSSEEITDGQYSVLAALSKNGAMTPGELAERDHVQPPSMTRTVARLVEMGLVQRAEHPTDRRQVLVTITPAGDQEVRETRRRRDAWLSRRLAELTPAERATLAQAADILRRIASA